MLDPFSSFMINAAITAIIAYIIVKIHEGTTEEQINKLKRYHEIIHLEKELERTDLTPEETIQLEKEHYKLLYTKDKKTENIRHECTYNSELVCTYKINTRNCLHCEKIKKHPPKKKPYEEKRKSIWKLFD
ncbi:MAG: hypothetical protein FWF66_00315 [Candidatus Bathyarchaeota archaeon]|nr:hypothetical protein [Candidatus Termiticorpusculum sp.]